jgi:hypothetical protein
MSGSKNARSPRLFPARTAAEPGMEKAVGIYIGGIPPMIIG